MDAITALLAVSACHAGFQVVVSAVVYPALADVPADRWDATHALHSRRIVRVVAVLYPVVVAVCLWALIAGPVTAASIVAVAANLVAVAVTAGLAAPTHGRLGREHSTRLIGTLLVTDWIRTAAALVALVAACVV